MAQAENQKLDAGTPDLAASISRGVVGIYVRLYGRGPSRARTHIGDDFVMTVLEQTFTQAERTLVNAGKNQQVAETRRAFQEAVREDLIAVVEAETGRGVSVFMSQVDIPSEVAIELFLMGPGAVESNSAPGANGVPLRDGPGGGETV